MDIMSQHLALAERVNVLERRLLRRLTVTEQELAQSVLRVESLTSKVTNMQHCIESMTNQLLAVQNQLLAVQSQLQRPATPPEGSVNSNPASPVEASGPSMASSTAPSEASWEVSP
jgi:hypothetical protein